MNPYIKKLLQNADICYDLCDNLLISPVNKLAPWGTRNFKIIFNKNILSQSIPTPSPSTLHIFTDGSNIGNNVGSSVIVNNNN